MASKSLYTLKSAGPYFVWLAIWLGLFALLGHNLDCAIHDSSAAVVVHHHSKPAAAEPATEHPVVRYSASGMAMSSGTSPNSAHDAN